MALRYDVETQDDSSGRIPPRPKARRARIPERTVLLVASGGALLAFLDVTIVNIAFPSIRDSFTTVSIGTISWVLNAYNIIFAAFLIIFGRLGDLIGRRRVYLLGVGVFTLSSAVCALSPSVEVLIAARVVQALGAAMLVPASLAVVIDGFPAARRARAVGLWSAAAAVAAGLGPPVGGALVEAGGWRWAFWVNVPLGAGAWLLGRRNLVDSRAPGRRRLPDIRGALLLTGALALATTVIIKASEWGGSSVTLWVVAGGAVLLFGCFVLSSVRHPVPVLDLAMMRYRPFLVANIATAVAGVGFFAYMLTNVLWLQYVWHYTVLESGLALVPGAVAAAATAGLLEPVAERLGYRWVIAAGFVVWVLSYVWYVEAVGTSPAFLAQWLPGQIISGIGVGATLPLLAAAGLVTQPGDKFGTASAVISSTRQVGGTIGIALLVAILGTPTALNVVPNLRHGWQISIYCFAAGAVIALCLGPIRQRAGNAAADAATAAGARVQQPDTSSVVLSGDLPPEEHSLFRRLPESTRIQLNAAGPRWTVPAGDWLMRRGETADRMFVLLSGRAEVVIGDEVVRELGPGAVIGELALLTGGERSASVRARRDCEVLEISKALMDKTIAQDPVALSALVTVLAGRLADARPPVTRTAARPGLVAVIGAGPGADADAVAALLHTALSRRLRVALLPGHSPRAEIDRAESDNRLVLVVSPTQDTESAARCAREADVVVLVGRMAEAPPSAILPTHARPELVLVGATTATSRDAWLLAVDPWRVSRLTDRDVVAGHAPSAIQGLADRLSGEALGLVFGGGGARALSQVGVLLELEAAGVRVDRLAGTSMGAVIAGMYATGVTADEVSDTAYQEFVRESILSDYHLPRTSLARGARVRRALQRSYRDLRIEQLPRGFRCVSTDLLTRTSVVHRSGSLADAIGASSQLPVLLPPIARDGRLLVDGGVLDNLPVGTLTERNEGPIIAVGVSMSGQHRATVPGQPARPVRVPPLGETLLRTLMIGGGTPADAARLGAWVLTPHSMGVGLLEFHQFDRMVESGRAAARALLEQTGGDLSAGSVDARRRESR
ncbi:MFS transporter [Flexivirga endophytica]|uniref:MFS transporter n=1 Tax=Flexivirga endophytica TaxID=1849103 RepID=A0A916T565_9MICO|nr:MDR family MFS transporter/patatin-like phospholipase family protein [Flexivirga endophytica]GGB32050.1 MFS transporter [Flexivirga endophytica]GHB53019.1 MFS transporter [Flexivirga endophytica]